MLNRHIENCTWRTNFRDRFLVHAASRPVPGLATLRNDLRVQFGINPIHTHPTGI